MGGHIGLRSERLALEGHARDHRAPPAGLRRLDWRFLLPHPPGGRFDTLLLLGGSEALAARIVEVGVARRVCGSLGEAAAVEAAVVLHPARVEPEALARALRPGAALYIEIDRRSRATWAATPARVQRALRRTGLSPTGLYAARPRFEACELFLPLDPPAALRWYVHTLYPAATPLQWLAELALRLLTGLDGRRFARWAPCYAVTAVAGDGAAPARALGAAKMFHTLRPLLLAGGEEGGNRVTVLPFAGDGTQPTTVLKIPKRPTFNGRNEAEQQTLRQVRARLGAGLRGTLPEPLATVPQGDVTTSVESYLPGECLARSTGRWGASEGRKIADLRLAASWLAEFHGQTELERLAWNGAAVDRWVAEPLAHYEQRLGATAREARLFALTLDRARALEGGALPLVWQHRDFNVWNLFREGNRLHVIDWEGGRPGLALCDLLHFVTHWHDAARHGRGGTALAGFRQLFLRPAGGGTLARAARESIADYMAQLRIAAGFLPVLLVGTWVELALRRWQQQREMGSLGGDPRAANRFAGYVEVLADHATFLYLGGADG